MLFVGWRERPAVRNSCKKPFSIQSQLAAVGEAGTEPKFWRLSTTMMTAATLNQAQGARRLTYVQNPHNNLANLVFCYLLFTDREVKVPGKFGDLSKVTCAS